MMIVPEKEGIAGAAGDPGTDRQAASSPPPPPVPPRRLHNFSFPTLSWGGQRFLRCSKLPDGVAAAGSADQNHRTARTKPSPARLCPGDRDWREGESRGREVERTSSFATAAEADRPWNLRTRRAACNAPAEEQHGNLGSSCCGALAVEKINFSVKTLRRGSDESEKGEIAKFSVSLSRAEIEEDFFAIKGTKPPRRPKKRAKVVQRELDSLFPGLWLSEITPDAYKIDEQELG